MRNFFSIVFLFCFFQYKISFAADTAKQKSDSINFVLEKMPEDTSKANALIKLALSNISPELSLEYATKALKIEKRFNDKKRLGFIYRKIGNIYYEQFNNYEKGLEFYFQSLKFFQEINDKEGIANCYNNIGNIYNTKGDFLKNESDYNTALSYHLNALKLREELNDRYQIANSAINIGSLFLSQKKYAEALTYFKKSFELYSYSPDKEAVFTSCLGLAEASIGIGDYKKALEYLNKSESAFGESPLNFSLIEMNRLYGELYFNLKEYERSITYFQKALLLSQKFNSKISEQKIYFLLTKLYDKKNDCQKAYYYYQQHVVLKDSLLNAQVAINMDKADVNYKLEKAEKAEIEIASLKQEKEIQKIQLIALVAFILLIIVSSVLFYNRYRVKQKELFNAEVLRQQELRSVEALEVEEKERNRIARDLHDGIGQLLSAIQLNVSALDKNFLQKDEEQSKQIKNISHLVDESIRDVRTLSHNLFSGMFGKSKLDEAVTEFVNKMNATGKINIDLELFDLPENLNKNLTIALYRVIQEAINNIIKHAQAKLVTIKLIGHEKELTVVIEDDGIGFDVSKKNQKSGIGIENIYSRIAYWKGDVNIDSQPGKGTTIIIEVPYS